MKAIKWLKENGAVLCKCTGADADTWDQACKYLSDINNITANETLDWNIPYSKHHGLVTDISPWLQYQFNERIYYLDTSESFPSTKEKPGCWMGVAKNVGDALTYEILTDDTRQIIKRSIV